MDLGIDAGTDGLQMYETTDLLLRRRPIQNDVPCILWQANAIAEPTYETDRRSPDQFLPLQGYLLEFYPPEHPITLVLSKTFPLLNRSQKPTGSRRLQRTWRGDRNRVIFIFRRCAVGRLQTTSFWKS